MDRSMPGLPVCHQLQEFTQTHVHRVGDATQPSHPLSSPSPPALNLLLMGFNKYGQFNSLKVAAVPGPGSRGSWAWDPGWAL